jgi:hypothetical protein
MTSWVKKEGLCDYCGSITTIYTSYQSKVCEKCAWKMGREYPEHVIEAIQEMLREAEEKK